MNKLIELCDKPTILWTNQDKYELIIELFKNFWWIIIPIITITIIMKIKK